MLAVIPSAILFGLVGRVIQVEVDVAPGLPGFTVVGLADAALQEARERVRGALRNSGFQHPPRRITVNLAPADVRKAGSSLDVAIAYGILLGSEQVRAGPESIAMIGELSLGGEVRSVPGVLPMASALRGRGVRRMIVAEAAVDEARLVEGLEITGVAVLRDVIRVVTAGRRQRLPAPPRRIAFVDAPDDRPAVPGGVINEPVPVPDLSDVRGQLGARRGLEIALSGGHGMLLIGPPGSGKTLLARTIPGLLPPLGDAAAMAATIVASAVGEDPINGLRRSPPFRAPHHTLSYAAMVGGGPRLSPGEVTRAHEGILFLDELPEFDRDVLEALRQPLEEGRVAIARAGRAVTFPARFQLVAAMNPCPCGYAGSTDRPCGCPVLEPERYQRRISGPLRDRIDLWLEMPRVPPVALVAGPTAEDSLTVAGRIATAREIALRRTPGALNGRLSGRRLRAACALGPDARARVIGLADLELASGRGTERLLRVARTIADLAGSQVITTDHLDESARYRPADLRHSAALAH